jgi:hypothetical protein
MELFQFTLLTKITSLFSQATWKMRVLLANEPIAKYLKPPGQGKKKKSFVICFGWCTKVGGTNPELQSSDITELSSISKKTVANVLGSYKGASMDEIAMAVLMSYLVLYGVMAIGTLISS